MAKGHHTQIKFEFHYVGYFTFFGFCYGARRIFYGPSISQIGHLFQSYFCHKILVLVIKAFLL
jgi:hypothetical protein